MLTILVAAALAAAPAAQSPPANQPPVTANPSGLRIQTLVPGTGAQPRPEDIVLVTYEGRLPDGSIFDAQAEPVSFPVSALVPGFTEGLLLMRKGGRYRIWIPPALAYGEEGAGGVIPPNAELDFTVSLIDILPAPAEAPPQ